jgi:hypothetical protein
MSISTGQFSTGLVPVGLAMVTGATWIVKSLAPYGVIVGVDQALEYLQSTGETEENAEASEGVPLIPGARQIAGYPTGPNGTSRSAARVLPLAAHGTRP